MTLRLGLIALLAAASGLNAVGEPQPASAGGSSPAYLGVHIDAVTPAQASALKLEGASGAIITAIDQDGPACRAGLKDNDVVVGFNGSKVESPQQLQELIHGTPAGQTVKLTVVRGGQKKDIAVALGSWPTMPPKLHSFAASSPGAPNPPPPPMAYPMMPEGNFSPAVALAMHHGAVVETLSTQLAEYFGVPRGQGGVLVRSVETGSPASAAGLKAGDVVVKVNNAPVHDMADFHSAMHVRAGKITVVVMRDKHEQTLIMNLPAPDTSWLNREDWQSFGESMQAFREQMEKMRPELERSKDEVLATMKPSDKELEELRRSIEKSMKLKQKDIEKMQKEIQKSVPSQKEMEEMQKEILKSMPSEQDMQQMRQQVEDAMKTWTPQFQKQMEQLKKQMEQQKLDMQQMMKDFDTDREF